MKPKAKNDFDVEDVLQAIVVADSYNVRFAPISDDIPRCLFPFCGSRMIDYVLTSLQYHEIDEVIVYCTAHGSKIRQYISTVWSERLNVTVVVSETATSVGDALRDLDSKDMIQSDFILLHGDQLTNVDLRKILFDHKKRREKEKSCLMSIVCSKSGSCDSTGNISVLLDPQTRQILQYKTQNEFQQVFRIQKKLLKNPKSNIILEFGFRTTDIAVCSVSAPMFLTENFDFQTIDDLTRGALVNVDIHGYSVFIHELHPTEVSYRIKDMMEYEKMCMHNMSGLLQPFTPGMVSRKSFINVDKCSRCYVHPSSSYPHSYRVIRNVLVDENTKIGKSSFLDHCTIGKNCTIGENVRLTNCFLWDNVTVESNSIIEHSLIGHNCIVKSGSSVLQHSVLSPEVVVGPNASLHEEILVLSKNSEDKQPNYGTNSNGFKYVRKTISHMQSMTSDFTDGEGLDADDENYVRIWTVKEKAGLPFDLTGEESSSIASGENDDYEEMFYSELRETMERFFNEKVSTDNFILDINSLKHAYFIPIDDLHTLFMKCVMEYPFHPGNCKDSKSYKAQIMKVLEKVLGVFKFYIKDDSSSLNVLRAFGDTAAESDIIIDSCVHILHFMYSNDIFKEEIILKWYEEVSSEKGGVSLGHDDSDDDEDDDDVEVDVEQGEEGIGKVLSAVGPFIKWLAEAEEESDSSDDE